MPARVSESLVLRTYPLQEADLIVSFFTRDHGKLRGVAKRARKPKGGFGSALERLSHNRITYSWRENRELVQIASCELIRSQFALVSTYEAGVALDFLAEVSDQLLPPAETNEKFFRLLVSVLDHLHTDPAAHVWPAVTYFSLWAVRLSGILPELRVAPASRAIAEEMFRTPVALLAARPWTKTTAADLRRFLVRSVEDHVERKLISAGMLEAL
jgi:DNA repair protein RecO (recombination protein O)